MFCNLYESEKCGKLFFLFDSFRWIVCLEECLENWSTEWIQLAIVLAYVISAWQKCYYNKRAPVKRSLYKWGILNVYYQTHELNVSIKADKIKGIGGLPVFEYSWEWHKNLDYVVFYVTRLSQVQLK